MQPTPMDDLREIAAMLRLNLLRGTLDESWQPRCERLQAWLDNGPQVGEWIPVGERLPEPVTDVLVVSTAAYDDDGRLCPGREILVAQYEDGEWYGYAWQHEVSHWMPLPPLPNLPAAPERRE